MNYTLNLEFSPDGTKVDDIRLSEGGQDALTVYVDGNPAPVFSIEHHERDGEVMFYFSHVSDGGIIADYGMSVRVEEE